MNHWFSKDDQFKYNWAKVYDLIFDQYCSREIHNGIRELTIFKLDIRDDPLGLLKNIEKLINVPMKVV